MAEARPFGSGFSFLLPLSFYLGAQVAKYETKSLFMNLMDLICTVKLEESSYEEFF
jgi:hypothetical protein